MIYLSNNAKQQSYIQKKELSLQREELNQTREELKGQKEQFEEQNKTLKIQRFENTFFQMLTQFQKIVNNITYFYKDISGKVYTVKGRQAFYDSFEIAEHESKLPDWHPTKNLRTSIDDLSKYTHVEPETFDVDITTVSDVSYNIMEDTLRFFMTINEAKLRVGYAIDACIDEEMVSQFYYETHDEIDILATHHEVLGYLVTSLTQLAKDDETITMKADGFVSVRLQYGSDGDMRRGDGYETKIKLPFTSTFVANYKNQDGDIHIESAKVDVDNDSFFE